MDWYGILDAISIIYANLNNFKCFDELTPEKSGKGKKNELRTALQLIRGQASITHAIAYSIGFTVQRGKLVPVICIELECVDAP